jgi:Xaa-Pro aminopeptidase
VSAGGLPFAGRIAALAATLEQQLLVLEPTNVRYLSGLRSTNPALLVQPSGEATLYSDFRYAEAGRAAADAAGISFTVAERSLLKDLAGRIAGRVGFESRFVTYAAWQELGAGGVELVPTQGAVEALRAVKDEAEIELIRRACAVTTRAYEAIVAEGLIGRTEQAVAARIEALFRELGGDGSAFPPIVAAHENGARPHADCRDVAIGKGTLVTIDCGARLQGYCADCTRTFSTGDLPAELRRAYDVCLEAEQAGYRAILPGVTGDAAHQAAAGVIAEAGWAHAFGHGLGHGVGLDIHEAPTLRPASQDVLGVGNVVSCEPGIYLDGLGGVRIEDLLVVREGAAEVLTGFTRELVTVH